MTTNEARSELSTDILAAYRSQFGASDIRAGEGPELDCDHPSQSAGEGWSAPAFAGVSSGAAGEESEPEKEYPLPNGSSFRYRLRWTRQYLVLNWYVSGKLPLGTLWIGFRNEENGSCTWIELGSASPQDQSNEWSSQDLGFIPTRTNWELKPHLDITDL